MSGNGHDPTLMYGIRMYDMQGGVMPPEQCPDVVFALPSYQHSVSKRFQISMAQTGYVLHNAGLTSGFMCRDGDAFVAKARNKLVGDFLFQFPMTQNFFFIDDDVGWPPDKIVEFVRSPEDVICGAYPKKHMEIDFPVNILCKDGALVEKNGLLLAILAPTGFMRIKRHVLEKMAAKAGTFRDREAGGDERWYPNIFESGVGPDHFWWGEDYTFCRKWQDMGGEIWIDPNIPFYHQGLWNWQGRLADHLHLLRSKAVALAEKEAGTEPKSGMLSVNQAVTLKANIEQAMAGATNA